MTMSGALRDQSSKRRRTLVIGATGFMGRFLAEASLESGRPTFALVRPTSINCPVKSKLVNSLQEKGAIILQGSSNDKDEMEQILKENEIDIVIAAVGGGTILDQLPLIEAIKAVGTIKRFLPSEFGHDVDKADPVEPGLTMYEEKRKIRRATEDCGVPYTYICCNSIASWPYHDNCHPSQVTPPLEKFEIYGDGNVKAYFIAGTDIGKFTMNIVVDPRTINKTVHFRPVANGVSINELASLWEKKIDKTLPRLTISEEDLLKFAAENILPQSIVASFTHDIFIRGCQVNFSIDGINELEVTELYPEERFKSLDECYNDFATQVCGKTFAPTEGDTTFTNSKPLVKTLPISVLAHQQVRIPQAASQI